MIVVGTEVNVAFLAAGAECSSAPLMGMTVQVWRCTGLDTSRARIRVLEPTQILIAVPAG